MVDVYGGMVVWWYDGMKEVLERVEWLSSIDSHEGNAKGVWYEEDEERIGKEVVDENNPKFTCAIVRYTVT